MDETLNLCLAPLRGVTGCAWRVAFCRHFGGLNRALSPFIPTVRGTRIRPALLTDVLPQHNQALPLVPQAIGKDPADLTVLLAALHDLGYACADLNAGCPWPMVARKGRGAGLLANADVLRRMLDAGCTALPGGFSIKVRLGLTTPDLLAARMEILNAYPLSEVTIHPRTAKQMYTGQVDLDAFAVALRLCRHRVVYNGDIRTARDGLYLRQRFPSVDRWMIGRGLIADPWLAERLRGDLQPRTADRLHAFLDDLFAAACAESSGDKQVLGRLKEMWGYLAEGLSPDGHLLCRIHLCHRLDEYRRVVDEPFARPMIWHEVKPGLPGA